LVKELKSTGPAYRQHVSTVMRASYSHHYRRVIPALLRALEFRSNNQIHQPVIRALDVIKRTVEHAPRFYDPEEVPLEGIVSSGWRDLIIIPDKQGRLRVDRLKYELCVLQVLRERLRCKEIWVVGGNRYRNPDEDLPTDFEVQREQYYTALNLPRRCATGNERSAHAAGWQSAKKSTRQDPAKGSWLDRSLVPGRAA
jgi:hypothetical protein